MAGIVDQFLMGKFDSPELEYVLKFANPFETKIEPMAFTNPNVYGKGARDGAFIKIIDAFLGKRISLNEFGGLIDRFSRSCLDYEWLQFYKPVLEQRLIYPWSKTHFELGRLPDMRGPIEAPPKFRYSSLPPEYYVGIRRSSVTFDIRIGKGECDIFYGPFQLDSSLDMGLETSEVLTHLMTSNVQYGIRTSDWRVGFRGIELNTLDDFFLWDDHWSGVDLRRTFRERRNLAINLFQDVLPVSDLQFGSAGEFNDRARLYFEQGFKSNVSLVVYDANSRSNVLGCEWFFINEKKCEVVSVHGDEGRGMDHLIVQFDNSQVSVYQGDIHLTLNTRRKIYQEREAWVGKSVWIAYDTLHRKKPNYAYWKTGKE